MRKMKLFKVLLASAIVVSAVACKDGAQNDAASEAVMEKEAAVQVKVKQCFNREVEQIESFTATVEANAVNKISPKMALRISNIYVEVGDRVSKGQKLAKMEDINMTQARLQMQNDSLEFERTDNLYKVGGVSKSVWDARKLAYSISSSNYKNLLENTALPLQLFFLL